MWILTQGICCVLQGNCAGCPYKVLGADELSASLSRLRIAPRAVADVVAKARAGHYQLACALAWEGVHGAACDTGINHPNQVTVPALYL
jgi:DNA primase large subunit